MACMACENLTIDKLFEQAHIPPGHSILHSSYDLLNEAASNGCSTCHIFQSCFNNNYRDLKERLAQIQKSRDATSPIILFLQMAFPQNGKRPISKLHVQIGDEPDRPGTEQLKISFRVSRSSTSIQATGPTRYTLRYTEIDHDLGSEINFSIAQDWIHDCCDNHDATTCPAPLDINLPTRLIDVGTSTNLTIRLVETSRDDKGKYLALSHCWGPPETKKLLTTTKTLNSHLALIDQNDMPANFSDAVIITRRLGYRYLWIDSLCIIQDSKLDWETESQNMGRVYTNAAITLAAAAATSSEGGMLTKGYQPLSDDRLNPQKWFLTDSVGRSHLAFQNIRGNMPVESLELKFSSFSCRIKINQDDEARSIILSPLTEFSDMEENWFRCTALGPLGLRGWCLQEKLLSRRILYYGTRQIYWQCASTRKAADGEEVPASAARSQANMGNEVSDWPDVLRLKRLRQEAINTGSFENKQAVEIQVYKAWHNVLYLYINRRLTYDSDRLPGLAGMATLIQELTGDQYVAGFWRKYLLVSLVWTHTKSFVREDVPRAVAERFEAEKPEWEKEKSRYTGPSWSWCSHDFTDVLDFWADHDETYRSRIWKRQDAEIIDVSSDIVGNNPFGQVNSGELVLRGFTYPRWDVRTLDEGAFQRNWAVWSSVNLGICPHSPWNRDRGNDNTCQDRAVLWDYWPRQTLSPAKRAWKHLLHWFLDLFKLLLWHGLNGFFRERSQKDCSACNQYLCIHILSIVDKKPGRDGRYEVDLWSLVLEPVAGDAEKYRRIGIARKAAYVSEDEFSESDSSAAEKLIPKVMDEWECRELIVV